MNAPVILAILMLNVQTLLIVTLVAVKVDTMETEHTVQVFLEIVSFLQYIIVIKLAINCSRW